MNFDEAERRFTRAFGARRGVSVRFGSDRVMLAGFEQRVPPQAYDWDGMARGGRADRPYLVFQYTLRGFGTFAHDGAPARRVEPGDAFCAIVPSAHRYRLPPESPGWTFAWLLTPHRFVVDRIAACVARRGPVLSFEPGGPMMSAMLRLFEGVCQQSFRDAFAWEAMAFNAMLELERSCAERQYAPSDRAALLADVAARAAEHGDARLDVATLAAAWRMTRSHFSHHFKATTGLSPARYLADLRLDRVAHQLTNTHDKLDAIARRNGFANANHLGKAFRKHFHISPGAFRGNLR